MNESLGWQPKERSPSLAPDPLIRRVVNELLWVAATRTFTIPGPWPLVRLVSGVVNELLGWRPKERSPSLAPGPFVFTVGFLTCLTITAFTDGHRAPTRHELNRGERRPDSLVGAVESFARYDEPVPRRTDAHEPRA